MNTRASVMMFANFLLVLCLHPAAPAFQGRDHLTPQEVDLIKDTQVLDKRIEVFIKAADRRVLVLTGTAATNAKQLKKDSEKWGELPAGNPGELISDIARIFDEAITNIDDVSAHDEKNPLIPKALRKLATAASRIVEQVKPLGGRSTGASGTSFDQLLENADAIVQAANQLPPEVAKKGKGKEEKPKTTN
jgi:hypothetical protein